MTYNSWYPIKENQPNQNSTQDGLLENFSAANRFVKSWWAIWNKEKFYAINDF